MILEIAAATSIIDWTSILLAGIGVITGGALLKILTWWSTKKKADRADDSSYEKALRDRISELEDKVDLLTGKITELVESNSEVMIKLSSENAALIVRNQNLHEEIERLKGE
jgi:hypothetical protein